MEQNEDYLDYIKNEEESILEKILNKLMEQYFATMFENVRQERGSNLLLSLTDRDILKQSRFTHHEIYIIKTLAH